MAVLLPRDSQSHQLSPNLRPRTSIALQNMLSPTLGAAPVPLPAERATTLPAPLVSGTRERAATLPSPSSPIGTGNFRTLPEARQASIIGTGSSEIVGTTERRSSSGYSGSSPRVFVSAAVRGHPDYGASPSPAWQPLAAPQVLPFADRQVLGSPSVHYASAPRSSLLQAPNGKQRWATLNEMELAGESLPPGSISLGLPEPALSGSHTSAQSDNATVGNASGNCAGTSAPSSALLAAVQLAAAHSSKTAGEIGTPSSDTPPVVAENAPGRRRWASMTEEEMTGGGRARKSSLLAGFVGSQQGTPVQRPAPAPAVPGAFVPNFAPARRRWASISDDEASPMIWPMKSPHMGRIMQQSGRRSLSSTPVIGPASQPGVSSSQQLPTQAVPSSPFMLPAAGGPGVPPTLAMNPMCPMGMPMGMPGMPMAPPGYGMPTMQAMPPTAPGTWGGNSSSYLYQGGHMQTTAMERPIMAERPGRTLNGWTVIWVGERAFRASATAKEQIESTGFLVKVYRTYDKCCRALDKKQPHLSPTTVYVVSEVDAEHMLTYLCRRGSSDLRFVVDAAGQAEGLEVVQRLAFPEDAICTVADSWDKVMSALRAVAAEVAARAPLDQPVLQSNVKVVSAAMAANQRASPPRVVPMSEVSGHAVSSSTSAVPMVQTDNPWTLIWISDQAFKPAAVTLKTQLEALGGQVKGYKTHKNAARALDKKRALTRTVVLVSGPEAAPFLAYLQGRPELASTKVVVEASSRSAPVRESPTVEVAESFDGAMEAVQRLVTEPNFS